MEEPGFEAAKHHILMGLCSKVKNEWNKWKNNFYEMKGDVGMSLHEKGREQEDAQPWDRARARPSLVRLKTWVNFINRMHNGS